MLVLNDAGAESNLFAFELGHSPTVFIAIGYHI